MSNALKRSLAIFEFLANQPEGVPVSTIAERLDIPASAAHRLLTTLLEEGYVRQTRQHGEYCLTMKISSLGMTFLEQSGVTDLAFPILDNLSKQCQELVRLSIVEDGQLIWVTSAQGAPGGLRYDPVWDQGVITNLAAAANGIAWLSTMSDDEALAVLAQHNAKLRNQSPHKNTPKTPQEFVQRLDDARQRGYAIAVDTYVDGIAAMAVPVMLGKSQQAIGTLSLAGPSVRMTPERMETLKPFLQAAATELALASHGSAFFAGVRSSARAKSFVAD